MGKLELNKKGRKVLCTKLPLNSLPLRGLPRQPFPILWKMQVLQKELFTSILKINMIFEIS